jgi:hypothetical protein
VKKEENCESRRPSGCHGKIELGNQEKTKIAQDSATDDTDFTDGKKAGEFLIRKAGSEEMRKGL